MSYRQCYTNANHYLEATSGSISSQMLSEASIQQPQSPEIILFLKDLQANGFSGDISNDYSSRVVASTDNSIWQKTPQVVITPHSQSCVEHVLALLSKQSHQQISVTARGGGTSTAGQTLTSEIVLDCKRHLHAITEYKANLKQVHVQCGAVLDDVNAALREFNVMLGPTVATASRATIGGMIGNDSAGKGSSLYGKMSDCVVELHTVLLGGRIIDTQQMTIDLARSEKGLDGELFTSIIAACENAQPHFKTHWPMLPRFLTGYNLPMALIDNVFNVNRILCGSEGTLGITTSAVLQCVEVPKQQRLLLLCFDSLHDALVCGASLKKFHPSAIEVVDEMVLDNARSDRCWQETKELFSPCQDDVRAILFVEFTDENIEQANNTIAFARSHYSLLHSTLLQDEKKMQTAWTFRSRSVGLLSATKGIKKPVPFVEDCAVPPDALASFIKEFKIELEKHGIQAGMFGHVDAGVIHVRPCLEMKEAKDRALVATITQRIAILVRSYGGVLWGEHGKGFRSEFGPSVFGNDIWTEMCAIKAAFDPYNQLNPGKVATPTPDMPLHGLNSPTKGHIDESIAQLPILSQSLSCDGNSECLSSSFDSAMCPTYRATGDPVHSPRGRANLIRAWLQEVGDSPDSPTGTFLQRLAHSGNHSDFSHEVCEALDGCLSCKACATHCPVQIDIPKMRTAFYNAYFGRYLRPLRDHVWFNMERLLPILSSRLGSYVPISLLGTFVGIVDTPNIIPSYNRRIDTCSPTDAVASKSTVVILQDSFTSFFRPQVIDACIQIMKQLGHKVSILEYKPSGKALHVRGNISAFKKVVEHNTHWLMPVHKAEIPIVGIDPATTLLWREEYPESSDTTKKIDVLLPQEWLLTQRLASFRFNGNWKLFPHCIESAVAHESQKQWKAIFENAGATLDCIQTSCCGMGGLFGHQKEYREQSLRIWDQNWAPYKPNETNSLVTGFSCQSQAKRVAKISLLHPLEVIATSIHPQQLPMV